MTLPCPQCGQPLSSIDAPELSVHPCSGCGGAWLDNRAAQVLIGLRTGKNVSQEARAALMSSPERAAGTGDPFRASGDPAKRCPECGTALTATRPPGMPVELDVCGAHGTWFDATELRACAQAMEMAAIQSDEGLDEDIAAIERSKSWGDDPILAAASAQRGWLSRLFGG